MDGLMLLGVSYRRGGSAVMDTYASAYRNRSIEDRLNAIGVSSFFVLMTCNRIDVIAVRPPHLPTHRMRDALTDAHESMKPYAYECEAALEQLARIAASLDSLNPGEDQIMRQVRDAATAAREAGHVCATLDFAIDAALRIAKTVRRQVPLAPRDTSLFSLARHDVERALSRAGDAPALTLVGAGEMAGLVVKSLPAIPNLRLTLVNRPESNAQRVAAHAAADAGVPVQVQRVGSMLTVFFSEHPVRDLASAQRSETARFGRWFHALLDRRVWWPPSQFEAAFMSHALDEEAIGDVVHAARQAFASISAA